MNIDISTTKKLHPVQIKTLQLLNYHPYAWVSTFELRNAGVTSPASCISNLKARGAKFERELRPARDHLDNEHERVAHYRFIGWVYDE